MKHNWQDVYWGSGRWKGRRAVQRQCSACEIWETRKTSDGECRGKTWAELTDAEKAEEFSK